MPHQMEADGGDGTGSCRVRRCLGGLKWATHIVSKDNQSAEKPPLMGDCVMAWFPSPAEQYVEQALDLNELPVKHPAGTFFVRTDRGMMVFCLVSAGTIIAVNLY